MSVIIALGGKKEKGARNEKNDLMPVFGSVAIEIFRGGRTEDLKEIKDNTKAATQNAATMMSLGYRMVMMRWGPAVPQTALSSS